MLWYVLYTKPRAEKRVAQSLEKSSIETYCPLITEVKQWSDRKKKISVPLFRSYVFVRLKERERSKVFDVPGVVRYLYWLGKPAIVRDIEIDTIREWLQPESAEEVVVEHLSPGDRIKIASGALKDEEAIVKEVGPKRVRLVLVKLGCAVSVRKRDVV